MTTPPPPPPKKPTASGGARLRAKGRHPVLLGIEPKDFAALRRAAEKSGEPMTAILTRGGMSEVKKILRKNPVPPLT